LICWIVELLLNSQQFYNPTNQQLTKCRPNTLTMKKVIFLFVFAILGFAGYKFYQEFNRGNSRNITRFIPDNTLILLETNELNTKKNTVLPRLPLLSKASNQYQVFKKIGLTDKAVEQLIFNKILFFAVIPEGKDSFSFVNYLPLTPDNEDFIEKLDDIKQNTTNKKIITHNTKGVKISEVIDVNAKSILAFIIQDNHLIFSSSNLALEEVVLHTATQWSNTLNLNKEASQSDKMFTRTHFNKNSIGKFVKDISIENFNDLSSLLPQTLQWQNQHTNNIEANGLSEFSTLFEGQKAMPIKCLNMIPNASSYIVDLSFSNPENLTKQLEKTIEKDTKINTLRSKAASKFDFDFKDIYGKINDEVTLCSFDNSEASIQSKVLIIKQKDLIKQLNLIARNGAEESESDVFSVQFSSFLITSLGIKEFPMLMFGKNYFGFSETYFVEYNDYIILASSLPVMQEYLISISKGNVWSNSPKNKKIIDQCLPANLTVISENEKAFKGLEKVLNANWQEKITDYENLLSSVQAEILQCSATESRLVLLKNIEPVATSKKANNNWAKLGKINASSHSEPLYLINPLTKKTQILIQNTTNQLQLFEDGKRIWTYPMTGKIVGQIKNIKFDENNSQQLLVATNSKIYILSRNENGFNVSESKTFKQFNLANFKVFENEEDRKQAIYFVSENGESFKLDKKDLVLKPVFVRNQLSETLVPMPSVIVKGREFAVILEKTGKLSLQNVDGKKATGFPINLNGVFTSPPLLEDDKNNVIIRLISEQGDLYKISLEGKILEKRQLFRPDNEAKFSMATDERQTDWVLMRTDGKEVVVLDKSEKEILSIKGLSYGKKLLIFYNLGIAGRYFAVNNSYESYRFYDETGDILGNISLESIYKPILSYSDSYKKIIVNLTTPTTIETWSIKIK
jgi:hypothetical protein